MTDAPERIWKDATKYRKGRRGKDPATAWETEVHGSRVWISCGHRYHPEIWVMNCRAINVIERRIGPNTMSVEEARARALKEVATVALAMSRQLAILAKEANH